MYTHELSIILLLHQTAVIYLFIYFVYTTNFQNVDILIVDERVAKLLMAHLPHTYVKRPGSSWYPITFRISYS